MHFLELRSYNQFTAKANHVFNKKFHFLNTLRLYLYAAVELLILIDEAIFKPCIILKTRGRIKSVNFITIMKNAVIIMP